ncbi:MAG: hypothetical protein K6L74_15050 [Neptuniibacter sp.]
MSDVLCIGAFFDGTGNNIFNDEKIGDGSLTNIAKTRNIGVRSPISQDYHCF